MDRIIECVPNFSEGRNADTIRLIANAIEGVDGAKLLHIDSGYAANRTVYTFAGDPENVVEAAFRAAKVASELIDMTVHTGEHPRFGAMDVCPLVPVSGITMDETIVYARNLARRVGDELGINVYAYGEAAYKVKRRDLAYCRSGEYEKLEEKLKSSEWTPDFGPAQFNPFSGASAIGARYYLIAYNVNLNTSSVQIASEIAETIREKGKIMRENGFGRKIVRDEKGNPLYITGLLKSVKAIGWYIDDYKLAQVSMNLTNFEITPMHIAFDEVTKQALAKGYNTKGSEIIGLVPLQCMLDAGRYYLDKQHKPDISEDRLIETAIQHLGLNELYVFKPEQKILEYVLNSK
jgi:glutamate formiminotransferase / formiminotetrahydrofolate cyclodeaminase